MSLIAPNEPQFRPRPLRCCGSCCDGLVTFTTVAAYTAHLRARSHVRVLDGVPPRRLDAASPSTRVEAAISGEVVGSGRGTAAAPTSPDSPKGCA